jgi:hypothetical protein
MMTWNSTISPYKIKTYQCARHGSELQSIAKKAISGGKNMPINWAEF